MIATAISKAIPYYGMAHHLIKTTCALYFLDGELEFFEAYHFLMKISVKFVLSILSDF